MPLPSTERILLGPGPSLIAPRVMRALAAPVLSHLDPDFVPMLDDVRRLSDLERIDYVEAQDDYVGIHVEGKTLLKNETLAEIANALDPEVQGWGVLISGPGGIGKTALAIRAGHLVSDEDYPIKIFLSAKVTQLTPQGVEDLQDFMLPNYMALITELARELGEAGLCVRRAGNNVWCEVGDAPWPRLLLNSHLDTVPPGQATAQKRKGHILAELRGEKLSGRWHLVRTRPSGGKQQRGQPERKDQQERSGNTRAYPVEKKSKGRVRKPDIGGRCMRDESEQWCAENRAP